MQAIAETMQPSPMVMAMKRVAAATMIAAPLAMGGMAAPALASPSGTRGGASAPIVINVDARIMTLNLPTGANADDFERLLRKHEHEIGKTIDRIMANRARVSFDD